MVKFNRLIPELRVSDINKSKGFYTKIGFQIIYERVEDKFCFLELEGNQIMIEEDLEEWSTGKLEYPYGRGINISMTVDDVYAYYLKLKELNINFFEEFMVNQHRVNDIIYEDKEFLIQDPDGYLLRFND